MRTEQYVDPTHPEVLPFLEQIYELGELGVTGQIDLTVDITGLSYLFGVVDGAPCVISVWGDEPVLPESLRGVPVLRVVLKDSGPIANHPELGLHFDGAATAAVTTEAEEGRWYLVVQAPTVADAQRLRRRILNLP